MYHKGQTQSLTDSATDANIIKEEGILSNEQIGDKRTVSLTDQQTGNYVVMPKKEFESLQNYREESITLKNELAVKEKSIGTLKSEIELIKSNQEKSKADNEEAALKQDEDYSK